jgi:hypothetical protein
MTEEKRFIDKLKCPNCGTICSDEQADSSEEFKEEYCGECDTQFGYEEVTEFYDDLDDWRDEGFGQIEEKFYWSYTL